MYAVLRRNSFDAERLAAAEEALREFDALHASQPGYVGSVVVEQPDRRRLVLNLWLSEDHASRALAVLGPEVSRLLGPLMSAPSELVGVGHVIATDLTA